MEVTSTHDVAGVAQQFQIWGELQTAERYGSGHINDTYCVTYCQAGKPVRYILQRINHNIFKNPAAVMTNIQRVAGHLRKKLGHQKDISRRVLTLISAHDGQPFVRDAAQNYWRAYLFIEQARTYDAIETPRQAFEAAKAFGQFQLLLADLPAPRLHETIPDFHNTPKRFAALEAAISLDVAKRVQTAGPEIEFALKHQPLAQALLGAQLPERVTHNDTKLNNVMLDDATGEGICVIDLDTVMPGLALYDFGDMMRTSTSPTKEDELDLSKIEMQFPMFESLVKGYLSAAGGFLTQAEKQHLAVSGQVITFEIGLRFLTDYLSGDTYFKTHHANHNLERCRTQFKLVESMKRQEAAMNRLVEELS